VAASSVPYEGYEGERRQPGACAEGELRFQGPRMTGCPSPDGSAVLGDTTRFGHFTECLGHSPNPRLHSAKAFSSVTLGKGHSAAILSAKTSLPSAFCRALGKGFAECQKALGKEKHSAKYKSEKIQKMKQEKKLLREACTATDPSNGLHIFFSNFS
jgi:hypothetical protein